MVLLVVVRFVINAVTTLTRFAKKLVEVAFVVEAFVAKRLVEVLLVVVRFVIVAFVMVVVASVEVPSTAKRPEVVAFPCASTRKFKFSAHVFPFQ